MKRTLSLRTRLITAYLGIILFVFIGFGAYTYYGFKNYLWHALRDTLLRRANQIAVSLVDELPSIGEDYLGTEIQARYAPELNERAIRITDLAGREIYASKNASFLGDNPDNLAPGVREVASPGQPRFLVVTITHISTNGGTYRIETGGSETEIEEALGNLQETLLFAFPFLLGLAVLGGYILIGRALQPVDRIVQAAEQITFNNLEQRLPVPQTGDEVERLSITLNRMIERLQESYLLASRFSADASHELRTPLTVVWGELEVLVKEVALHPELKSKLENILEEMERLAHIVETLLLVSQLEGGAALPREVIELGALVENTAEQMGLLAEDKEVKLLFEIHPGIRVRADALRLRQLVVNLLDNAIKYTPSGGQVTLRVWAENRQGCLEIADTGIGISEEARPRIFERFYRAEETRQVRSRGTGLGLSIVKSIAQSHGGRISLVSQVGKGSSFRVELPQAGAGVEWGKNGIFL